MARQAKNKRNGMHSIQEELATLGSDVESLASTLGDVASSEARAAIQSIRDRLDDIVGEARAQGRAQVDALEETIQERPFVSVGAAFGLGFLIARLMGR